MGLNYVTPEPGDSQYEGKNLKKPVKATYVKAENESDRGNQLIEALPRPREGDATMIEYTEVLPEYREDEVPTMSRFRKMMQISELQDLRFALPFHQEVEDDVYRALVSSYSHRRRIYSDNGPKCVIHDKDVQCDSILVGNVDEATYGFFNIIGYPGSGKTSALHSALSRYPQVIMHDSKDGYFAQIVWIMVSCAPNNNFTVNFESFGDEVDKALGNTNHTYRDKVSSGHTVSGMMKQVEEIINTFSIGMVIFDEIENVDFKKNVKGSFSTLLTIMNTTKCAIVTAGIESVTEKMFSELHTARRAGITINTGKYCDDKDGTFRGMVEDLFRYQWFDEPVRVIKKEEFQEFEGTDEEYLVDEWNGIVDALYDETKGIVGLLIMLYQYACLDYMDRKKKPKVNGQYFRTIAKKRFPGIQKILKRMDLEGLFTETQKYRADLDETFDVGQQKYQKELIKNNRQKITDDKMMQERVIADLKDCFPECDPARIKEAVKKVCESEDAKGQNEMQLTVMASLELQGKRKAVANKKKTSKAPKVSATQMKDALADSVLSKKEDA